MLPVPVRCNSQVLAGQAFADAHGREALQVSTVFLCLRDQVPTVCARPDAHGRQALQVFVVPICSGTEVNAGYPYPRASAQVMCRHKYRQKIKFFFFARSINTKNNTSCCLCPYCVWQQVQIEEAHADSHGREALCWDGQVLTHREKAFCMFTVPICVHGQV